MYCIDIRVDGKRSALLAGWAEQLKPIDRNDIPPSLLETLSAYSTPGLETLPFSSVYVPFATA